MFQQQIMKNKRKTILVILAYLILFMLIGSGIGYLVFKNVMTGIAIALIGGSLYSILMIWQSSSVVMRLNNAQELTSKAQYPMFWNIVEDMSMIANVPMPKIYVIHDDSPNAFAAGTSPKNASVAATTGLLNRLNREELEGVIAHEFAHIKNYDVRLQSIVVALGAFIALLIQFSRFGMIGGSSRRRSNDNKGGGIEVVLMIVSIIAIVLAPIITTIMQYALSRNREYLADATAVSFTRNPQGLISALEKITDAPSMTQANEQSASLYIINPFKQSKDKDVEKDSLFSTHPATKNRINRLKNM